MRTIAADQLKHVTGAVNWDHAFTKGAEWGAKGAAIGVPFGAALGAVSTGVGAPIGAAMFGLSWGATGYLAGVAKGVYDTWGK